MRGLMMKVLLLLLRQIMLQTPAPLTSAASAGPTGAKARTQGCGPAAAAASHRCAGLVGRKGRGGKGGGGKEEKVRRGRRDKRRVCVSDTDEKEETARRCGDERDCRERGRRLCQQAPASPDN